MAEDEPEIFCETCRFYSSFTGECRRYAPKPRYWGRVTRDSKLLIDEDGDDGRLNDACWPKVNHRDWCGEFEAF
jgi:hypothetical protein